MSNKLSQKKKRILVIDDEIEITEIVDEFLTSAGYEVTILNSSQFWQDKVNEVQPDLLMLDIMMPGEDGYAICSQIKADPSTADIPVIFLSGRNKEDDRGRSFKSGGEMFIKKPFSGDRLLGIVNVVIASQ